MTTQNALTERLHTNAAIASDSRTDKTWHLPLWWLLAAASFPPAGFLANVIAGSVDGPLTGALAGAVAGAVIGAAQWLVLRRRIANASWWIPATSLGFALGLGIGTAVVDAGTGVGDLAISGAITGLAIGTAQFLVLRNASKRAWLWIPTVAASWPVGWVTTWAIGVDVDNGWSNFGASGALVFAIVTGLGLMIVLGVTRSDE